MKRRMMSRRGAIAALFPMLVVAAMVIAVPPARAEDTAVKIGNFTFAPQKITVKVGTTVTWTNEDDIPHTVVEKGLKFRSKALDTDDKFTFTFAQAGTFPYFCALHPHMTGTIVVEADSGKS